VRRTSIPLSISDVLQVRPACTLGLKPNGRGDMLVDSSLLHCVVLAVEAWKCVN